MFRGQPASQKSAGYAITMANRADRSAGGVPPLHSGRDAQRLLLMVASGSRARFRSVRSRPHAPPDARRIAREALRAAEPPPPDGGTGHAGAWHPARGRSRARVRPRPPGDVPEAPAPADVLPKWEEAHRVARPAAEEPALPVTGVQARTGPGAESPARGSGRRSLPPAPHASWAPDAVEQARPSRGVPVPGARPRV